MTGAVSRNDRRGATELQARCHRITGMVPWNYRHTVWLWVCMLHTLHTQYSIKASMSFALMVADYIVCADIMLR